LWDIEPSGLSLYNSADLTFDTLTAPTAWTYFFVGAPEDAIVAAGPTYANSIRFGWPGAGNTTQQQIAVAITNNLTADSYKKLGMGVVMRFNTGWVHHPAGNKIFYPFGQSAGGENRIFEFHAKPVGDGTSYKCEAEFYTGDPFVGNRTANLMDTVYANGTWAQFYVYAEYVGSTPTASNGILKWWSRTYDGSAWSAWVQNAEHTDVKMGGATSAGYWRRPELNLYWGGGTQTFPTSEQSLDVNRLRVSVG
jgi:hypothetical protein